MELLTVEEQLAFLDFLKNDKKKFIPLERTQHFGIAASASCPFNQYFKDFETKDEKVLTLLLLIRKVGQGRGARDGIVVIHSNYPTHWFLQAMNNRFIDNKPDDYTGLWKTFSEFTKYNKFPELVKGMVNDCL